MNAIYSKLQQWVLMPGHFINKTSRRENDLWKYAFAVVVFISVSTAATAGKSCEPVYVTPYGASAAWNRLATNLPTSSNSTGLVDRLWASQNSPHGNFNLSFTDYTYPVYHAACASGLYPVLTTYGNLNSTLIPWNPSWAAGSGSDGQVIVLDAGTGKEWNLWKVSFDGVRITAANGNLVTGDYRTKTDGFRPSRGVGIQYYAMVVRPEEIASGVIRHALSMPISKAGTTYVAPGTKSDGKIVGGIPQGTRFSLVVTDIEIETWIKSLPSSLSQQTRQSARVIARAMRDYGWFVTDSASSAHLQFENRNSAGMDWIALGLNAVTANWKEYPRDLLDGLMTKERMRAVVPSDQYPAN